MVCIRQIFNMVTGVLLLAFGTNCVQRTYNKSDIKHQAGKAGAVQDDSYWVNLNLDQLQDLMLTLQKGTPAFESLKKRFRCGYEKSDTALTQNLQKIVDIIYDKAHQNALERGNNNFPAPRPYVVVLKDSTWNAFALKQPFRFPIKINYIPAALKPLNTLQQQQLDASWKNNKYADVAITPYTEDIGYGYSPFKDSDVLIGYPNNFESIVKRENYYFSQIHAKCMFANWQNGEATVSSTCNNSLFAANLDAWQTIPAIFINAGLLAHTSFERVLGVVAHEMGHYLYAHGINRPYKWTPLVSSSDNLWTTGEGYLYNEDEYLKSGQPKPIKITDMAQEARVAINEVLNKVPAPKEGETLLRAVIWSFSYATFSVKEFAQAEDFKKLIKPTSMSSEVLPFASLLEFQCRRITTTENCDKFAQAASALMNDANSGKRADFYPAYTEAINSFAAKINLSYSNKTNNIGEKCMEDLNASPKICGDNLFWWTVDYMSMSPGFQQVAEKVSTKLRAQAQPTLADWLAETKSETDKLWTLYIQGTDYLKAHKLGWYSFEQQADDFSIEMLASFGYSPQTAVDLWVDFAKQEEKDITDSQVFIDKGYPLPISCQELRKKDFRDATGNWLRVRQTEWVDNHHSYCYRAFNMMREMAFHNYPWDKSHPPQVLLNASAIWATVQNAAQVLMKEAETCNSRL